MSLISVTKIFKNPLAKSISFAVFSTVIIILLMLYSGLLDTFELRTLDYRFVLSGTKRVESDIAVVFIGNEDIEDIGIWPWRRYYHAFLIDALKKHGASQIGFDILFPDPSKEEFEEDDLVLAFSAKEAENVVFISFFGYFEEELGHGETIEIVEEGKLPTALERYSFDIQKINLKGREKYFRRATKHTLPIPELLNGPSGDEKTAAQGIGYADCLPDDDGVTRKIPLLVFYNNRLYMSFPFILAANYLGITKDDIEINPGESIVLKKGEETYTIPINNKGEMMVNFSHRLEDFDAYSYNQLLQSEQFPKEAVYDLSKLKGNIAIIGTTYTGNTDLRSTPLDPAFPFLCLQATAIDNILQREFVYRPDIAWRILIVIIFCFIVNFLCSYTRPSVNFSVIFLFSSAYLYLTFFLFKNYGLWLDVIFPLIAVAFPYVIMTTIHYIYALFENIKYLERMKYLGDLVYSSHDAIFSFDLDGDIISWNNGAKQIYGYDVYDILGKRWDIFAPPDKEESLMEIMKKAMDGVSTTNYETNFIVKEGHTIIVNISVSPIINAKGDITGVSIISQDLTERKKLMEQIMESEKLAEIGRLSAGLAHEIKNPLTPIIFYAQSLAESEEYNPGETKAAGEVIGAEAGRILALTKDLLSFSRPKEEKMVPVDINKVVDDTVLLVIYQARKLGADTVKDLTEDLPKIKGEPDKIKQVLINLVMNAAHAMDGEKRGTIKLKTSVVNEDGQDFVEIAVEDNGSGMPQSVKDNLFKPFFTTKPKGVGTGLGLYISYNIIKQFDGTIHVESEQGAGTTFFIRLPVMGA
jgi:PAS domain S-box-containing protein